MNELDKNIRKISLYSGISLGILQLALNIFLFYFTTAIATSPPLVLIIGPSICSQVIPLVVTIFFSIGIRRKVGGLWTFRQAATGIFIMVLIAYAIATVGSDVIFYKVIEPYGAAKVQSADIKAQVLILEQQHKSPKEIEAKVNEVKKQFMIQDNTDIWHTLQGYIFFILFLFIFALVLAALLRNAKYVSASEGI